jgi:hypothetical protein
MLKNIAILLFVLSNLAFADTNWPRPNFTNCQFYDEAEKILKCKKNGSTYFEDYGKYYCQEFQKKLNEWTGPLKTWTENTGLCLQEMIYDNKGKRITPCSQMEEFAFDAHPVCYKQYGLCKLPFKDIYKIWDVVKVVHLLSTFRKSMAQVDNVILACLGDWLSSEESASYSQVVESTAQADAETKRYSIKMFEIAPTNTKQNRRKYFQRLLPLLLLNSESEEAVDVSLAYSEYFSNTTLSGAEEDPVPPGCRSALSNSSISSSKCDPKLARAIQQLRKNRPTIKLQKTLTKDRIDKILRSVNSWQS